MNDEDNFVSNALYHFRRILSIDRAWIPVQAIAGV